MPRQIFTDELWGKLKKIMLKMGIYDKPFLRQTIEGIFYRLRVVPGAIYQVSLVIGMLFTNASMNGLVKKN